MNKTDKKIEDRIDNMNSLKNTQLKRLLGNIYHDLTEAPVKGKTKKTKKAHK